MVVWGPCVGYHVFWYKNEQNKLLSSPDEETLGIMMLVNNTCNFLLWWGGLLEAVKSDKYYFCWL